MFGVDYKKSGKTIAGDSLTRKWVTSFLKTQLCDAVRALADWLTATAWEMQQQRDTLHSHSFLFHSDSANSKAWQLEKNAADIDS